jgi:hypothetical protein
MAMAQTKHHVYEKKIEKAIPSHSDKPLVIEAEKAQINLHSIQGNTIQVQIQLISKHPEKAIAKHQLDFLKYVITEKRKEIFLSNYILVNHGEELKARLKALYTIGIPDNRSITIQNTLGNTYLKNISGSFRIEVRYGKVTGEKLRGDLNLNLHVGDLNLQASELNASLKLKHTSSRLTEMKGNYKIESNLGSITGDVTPELEVLDIDGNGTHIQLQNARCIPFNLDLLNQSGSIYVTPCHLQNPEFIRQDTRKSGSDKRHLQYQNDSLHRLIEIRSKFGPIFIN